MVPLSLQDQLRQRKRPGRKPGVRPDSRKILALIGERGYVPERIAEATGCSPSTISNILSRRDYRVGRDLLGRLAAVLEVDPDKITLAGEAGQEAA